MFFCCQSDTTLIFKVSPKQKKVENRAQFFFKTNEDKIAYLSAPNFSVMCLTPPLYKNCGLLLISKHVALNLSREGNS
jgi:hypothetical protein